MKIIVHIGTEKTGTTALQIWMHENERALVRAGIWYCSTLGRTVNSLASVYAAGVSAGPEMLHIAGVHDEDGLNDFRQTVAADFRDEFKKAIKSRCSTFVISSEHLHSRITTDQQIERLKSLWAGFDVSEECILFLRPQADLARSLQSTAARSGSEVSQKRFLNTAIGPYFEYFDIYSRWKRGFSNALKVVPYKRHHSTVEWFCNHVGIDRNKFNDPEQRQNAALDVSAVAILNAINPHLDVDPKYLRLRNIFADDFPLIEPISYSRSDADTISERFRASNEALCSACPEIEMDDLTADLSHYPEKGNVEDLAECTFALPLANMVARFNCEIALLQAKCCVAEAHSALAKNKFSAADNIIHQGQEWVAAAKLGEFSQMERPINLLVNSLEDAAIRCQEHKTPSFRKIRKIAGQSWRVWRRK